MKFVALQPEHWPWVQEHIQHPLVSDIRGILMLDAANKPMGTIFGEHWTPSSCYCHWIISNPMALRRGLMEEWYSYAFDTVGRVKLFAAINTDTPKSLSLALRLGWQEILRLKDAYAPGVDMVHIQYTKEQWNAREEAA